MVAIRRAIFKAFRGIFSTWHMGGCKNSSSAGSVTFLRGVSPSLSGKQRGWLEVAGPARGRAIIIGWRGTDEHFLSLLENGLNRLNSNVPVHVVAGNPRISSEPGGFTEFLRRPDIHQYLQA